MRGVNDQQAPELLQFCLDRGYELRFIEQMPLDAQHGWSRDTMITADEILEQLGERFGLEPTDAATRGSAPAESFTVQGGPQTVGIIASVTRPFCGDCDRVRLTADGQVRDCLFARTESDLRTAAAGRRRRRGTGRSLAARRCGANSPATASTTRASCSRPGRCPRSAAERPYWPNRKFAFSAASALRRRKARPRAGMTAGPGSPTGSPCARHRPARSCAGRGCGSSGCSTQRPRRRLAASPGRADGRQCFFSHQRGLLGHSCHCRQLFLTTQ